MKKVKLVLGYFLTIIVLSIFIFAKGIKDTTDATFFDFFFVYLIILFVVFCVTLPIVFVIWLGFRKGKNNIERFDFDKDMPFFRDIIKEYSVSVIATNYDLFIDTKKQAILNLMYLKSRNKIDINNGYITVIDNETNDLDNISAYILNNIKTGFLKLSGDDTFNQQALYHFINKDVCKSDLVVSNINSLNNNKTVFWIIEIILILISILFKSLFAQININLFLAFLMLLIFIAPIGFPILYALYNFSSLITHTYNNVKYVFKRTNKGKEIMKKLLGLKRFMAEFTVMDKKSADEIELWDDYLIYSVLFNINNQVINEYKLLIK